MIVKRLVKMTSTELWFSHTMKKISTDITKLKDRLLFSKQLTLPIKLAQPVRLPYEITTSKVFYRTEKLPILEQR